ncbi:hypothetical protein GOP47_0015653 [Adiantum capillus-veneris]|uniref:Uncharacterized protein n=1 Tax=Adiantum capillus-veneris TaxID=13818 RepID=A0A9D4ZCT9_ADICA|nr:hypothetical protein GOP47_0015653 [Adiantum capillus-veneris]
MLQIWKPLNWWIHLHILLCLITPLIGIRLWLQTHPRNSVIDPAISNQNVDINSLVPHQDVLSKSPLRELIRSEVSLEYLSEIEQAIISEIGTKSALDVKLFAIPETVYTKNDNKLLYDYVHNQLRSARDVLSKKQGAFVLKLIESGVAQGSMMKKEHGDMGSLKNSIVVAFMKEEEDNLHFAMVAVSVEPRLGWRLITKKQRNEWNDVLSRVANTRLNEELKNLFAYPTKRVSGVEQPSALSN